MARIGSKITYPVIFFLLFALVLALYWRASEPLQQEKEERQLSEHVALIGVELPAKMDFAGEPVPLEKPDVRERIENEVLRNKFFHSATWMLMKRSNRWEKRMKKILSDEGIPEDFYYLMLAESRATNAVSPAGAKGFWQFMEPTARIYDLEVSKQVDQRLDPIMATHAACAYLNTCYKELGNWTLVAASYNMGLGGVQQALERQKVSSYYDLWLNSETFNYVASILAYKEIFQHPESYGYKLKLSEFYQPIQTRTRKLGPGSYDLVALALEEGITYKELRLQNPWLLTDQLDVSAGKEYLIEIPTGKFIQDETMLPKDSTAKDTSDQ